jgi:hypothetical protein
MTSRIWTAAELDKMTPVERQAVFDASIITDLADCPEDLLQKTRARASQIMGAAEVSRVE